MAFAGAGIIENVVTTRAGVTRYAMGFFSCELPRTLSFDCLHVVLCPSLWEEPPAGFGLDRRCRCYQPCHCGLENNRPALCPSSRSSRDILCPTKRDGASEGAFLLRSRGVSRGGTKHIFYGLFRCVQRLAGSVERFSFRAIELGPPLFPNAAIDVAGQRFFRICPYLLGEWEDVRVCCG